MSYGALILDAVRLAVRNPFLWFFGFFVSGTSTNINFQANFGEDGSLFGPGDVPQWVSGNPVLVIVAGVVIGVLIALAAIFLSVLSQGGIVDGIAALDRGEPRRFGSTFRAGLGNFWRVLGLDLLLLLIGLVILAILAFLSVLLIVATFAVTESAGLRILVIIFVGLLALVLALVLFVPLYIVGQFALRRLVLGGERVVNSISDGYGMFREYLGRSLLVWLIAVGLGIAISIVLVLIGLVLGLLFSALLTAVSNVGSPVLTAIVAVVAGLLLFGPLVVAAAIVGTFNSGYWTLAYLRIATTSNTAAEV